MRLLAIFMALFSLLNHTKGQICTKNQIPANLQNGLVAFYPFCGNTNDESGNGFNGVATAISFSTDRFGNSQSAGFFEKAKSSNLFVAANSSFEPTSYTYSAWINTNIIQYGYLASNQAQVIVAYSPPNWSKASAYGAALNITDNSKLGLSQWTPSTSWQYTETSAGTIKINTWYHVMATYDSKSGIQKHYLNGILINTIPSKLEYTGQIGFYIGASRENDIIGTLSNFFDGKIDDVGFWNRALSPCEVSQLYNASNNAFPILQTPSINSLSDTTSLCGVSKTLDAGAGFSSYLWSTGETTQSITPKTSGKYTVTVSDASGCTATDSTLLSLVNAKIIQKDSSVCIGTRITLIIDSTANSGSLKNVVWSNGSNFNTITSSPTITTKYQVTVSDGTSTCMDSVTITVVDTTGFNTLSDTTSACGASVTLSTKTGFTNYAWTTGATTQSISPTSSGFYKITASKGGCSVSDSTYLSIVQARILQRDTTICLGSSVMLSIDSTNSGTTVCNGSQLPTTLQNGLVGYYPFCGNASDASGKGNNGVVYGATLDTDRFNNMNSAYNFNGNGQYIDIGTLGMPNTPGDLSYSAWIKINQLEAGSAHPRFIVISKRHFDGGPSYITFTIQPDSSIMLMSDGYLIGAGARSGNILDGTWKMVTGIKRGNLLKVFIDGMQVDSTQINNTVLSSSNNFHIGHHGAWETFSNGKIDDVAVWNRALTDSEVSQLYRSQNVSWSTGATSNSITVTPTQTTKYYVTVSNGTSSCVDSITVRVNDLSDFNPLQDTTRVCGDSTILDAGPGFAQYKWSNGETTQKIVVKSSGKYSVIVTNTSGCIASDSSLVSIVKAKIIQRDTTICKGASITLSVGSDLNGGTNTVWSTGAATNSITVSPTQTTKYYVTVSDGITSCQDSITVNVASIDTSVNVLDNPAVCSNGGTVRMQAKAGASAYQWKRNGQVISGANSALYTATQSGNYHVVLTGNAGCQDSSRTITITIYPVPTPDFTINSTTQCLNENNFIFTNTSTISSGTLQYTWNFGDGTTSTSISPSKKYNLPGSYTITLVSTSNNLCVDSISKQITVLGDADSSISVLDPAEVCSTGGSVRIQAGNAASYSWFKDGIVLSGANASLFSATQSGNYQVVVRSSDGCADTSRTVSIVLNPQPVANFTINSIAQCLTENGFNFTNTSTISTGTMSYAWTLGDGTRATTTDASRSYTSAGTYNIKLVATSNKLCIDSITKTITVYPQPQIPVITGPDEFCKGSTIKLQTTGSPVLNWYKNDVLLTGETLNTLRVNQGGDYKVISTNSNGCKSSSLVKTVTENLLPVGTFDTPTTLNICDGFSLTLSASGASTYQWYYNSNPIVGATKATYDANAAGTYGVDFISNKGCLAKGTTTYTLVLLKKPVANFIYDTYCAGIQTNFSSKSIVAQSGLVRYFWQFGDGKVSSNGQNAFNTYANAGNYRPKLVVTPVECPQFADSTEILIAIQSPPAGITYPPINAIINRAQLLSARNIGISYQWTPGSYLSSSTSRTPTITTNKEQLYRIYITNQAGCNIIDTQLVRVFPDRNIYVPEGFTPDNDRHNDRLYPILVGIDEMRVFKIFNRWGTLVFDNKNANVNTGWNGTYLGRTQPMDTYSWIAEGIDVDGKLVTRTGNTILIR